MYYNYQRVHGSLGTMPAEKFCERIWDAPSALDVYDGYDPDRERLDERDYDLDQRQAQLPVHSRRLIAAEAAPEIAEQGAQGGSREPRRP